jgi:hypothetical protein
MQEGEASSSLIAEWFSMVAHVGMRQAGALTCKGDGRAGSTIDLVCISAFLYQHVSEVKVHQVNGNKKHAYVEVAIDLQHREAEHNKVYGDAQ